MGGSISTIGGFTTAVRAALRRIYPSLPAILCILALCACGKSDADVREDEVSAFQSSVVTADFDADGRTDLAVSAVFFIGQTRFPGEVQIFLQSRTQPGSFLAPLSYEVGLDPAQVATADLDGDNLPDLVSANENSDTVTVLLNQAADPGRVLAVTDYPCGPAPLSVAVGDLNRDSFPDLAVAVEDGVDILMQDSSARGRFFPPVHLDLQNGDGAFVVAVGDLDGDGINDLAVSASTDVQVFFQNPSLPGSFSSPVSFEAGTQPNGIALADMDGDGLLDMVVANVGSDGGGDSTVAVLLQDPEVIGNFLPARNILTPNGSRNVALGDLNGDTFPDIVVASSDATSTGPGRVSVFIQNAAGDFLFSEGYDDGQAESVALGNLNGDLLPDIAVQDGPSILFHNPASLGRFLPEVLLQ